MPGYVLVYQTQSGRHHLLAVRALDESRSGVWPVVELLRFEGTDVPASMQGSLAARVRSRRQGLCTGWLGHQAELHEERDLR